MDLLTGGWSSRRRSDGKSTSPLLDDALRVCDPARRCTCCLELTCAGAAETNITTADTKANVTLKEES